MNHRLNFWRLLLVLVSCSLAATAAKNDAASAPPRYKLVDLGTLGGPNSYLPVPAPYHEFTPTPSLSANGTFAGFADTAKKDPLAPSCFVEDCFLAHSFTWRVGKRADLGALDPRLSSAVSWISPNGVIVGFSENGQIDPLIKLPAVVAVAWQGRTPVSLGTLAGGYESQAISANSLGQIVGLSSNLVPDDNSLIGTTTQVRAVLWQNGQMQDLGTLPGGTDAMAILINERGQIVGQSYSSDSISPPAGCEFSPLTLYAFFWDKGRMTDLGTLGGHCAAPYALNIRGQVVGQANTAGDVSSHPFLWQPGKTMVDLGTVGGDYGYATGLNDAGTAVGLTTTAGEQALLATLWQGGTITNLGTLPGDNCSAADTINSSGQIVGGSGFNSQPFFPACDGVVERAVLWENGTPVDLNTLIAPGSNLTLNEAWYINDAGVISGVGSLPNGKQHAFVLLPCGHNSDSEGCGAGTSGSVPPASHPSPIRRLPGILQRYPAGLMEERGRTAAGPARAETETSPDQDFLIKDRSAVLPPANAFCEASPGLLTGKCVAMGFGGACYTYSKPGRCPAGQHAGQPVRMRCRNGYYWWDTSHPCG